MLVLTPEQRSRVAVVLVRARNPHNIGAVARAMHDFGFTDLRLVNEYTVPLEAAQSAVDASEVIASARSVPSVAEAVADCTLVLGTTAVGERRIEHPLDTLQTAAAHVAKELPSGSEEDARIALLFGSEKTGLSNDELSFCHRLVTIPMHQHEGMRHPSMNLGQAAAVCLYELVRGSPMAPRGPAEQTGTMGDVERMRDLLSEVLEVSEYRRRHPANSTEAHLRRLSVRLAATRSDVPVWMGILRQVLWKLRQEAAEPPSTPLR